jgi:hypothetical protein
MKAYGKCEVIALLILNVGSISCHFTHGKDSAVPLKKRQSKPQRQCGCLVRKKSLVFIVN